MDTIIEMLKEKQEDKNFAITDEIIEAYIIYNMDILIQEVRDNL